MRAQNLFVQALGKVRERYKFLLVGYVVMPNHVHLLISETPKATPSLADDAGVGGDDARRAEKVFEVIDRSAGGGKHGDALAAEEDVFGGGVAGGVGFVEGSLPMPCQ